MRPDGGGAVDEAYDDAGSVSCLDRLHRLLSFVSTERFLKFLSLFCSFLCMGLTLAVIGPSLLELGMQTGASLTGLVYIFSGRSLGFFSGTILGGDFVDRWKAHGFTILCVSLSANVIFTFFVPLIPWLAVLILVCFLQGTALGVVDNLSQVLLIRLMDDGQGGKQVQPYMQALHAAFGVGAFFAPLIMSPFLGGEALYIDPLTQVDAGSGGGVNGTAVVPQTTTIVQASGSTTYHYAYFLICLLNMPVVLSLGYYTFRDEITWAQVVELAKRICLRRRDSSGSGGSWDRVGSGGGEDSGSGAGYADEQNELSTHHHHHHSGSSSEFGLASPSNVHASADGVEMSIVLTHDDEDDAALELGSGHLHRSKDDGADAVFRPDEDSPDAAAAAGGNGRRDSRAALLLANGGVGAMHVIMPHVHDAPHTNGHASRSGDQQQHLQVHDLASPDSAALSSPPSAHALMVPASPASLSSAPSPSPSLDDDTAAASSSPNTFRAKLREAYRALKDPKWKLVLLISLFLFLYVGCESGYAAYLFTYGVQQLGMDPASAAYLNATFWFSFAFGRLIAIPLSLHFTSVQLIFTDLAGCILCVLAMIIFHDSLTLLWVGTVLYGISVASIYPSAIVYAESQVDVNGRVLSLMTVSASLGDAIVPLLMGLSFESPTGPLGLMLIAAGVAVGAAVIFAVIVGCVAPGNKRGAADEAEAAEKARKRKASRKKKRAAAVAAVAAAQAAASVRSEHDPTSAAASDAASSVPLPHRDRAPSPTPKPKRSQYASLETSDDSEHAESAVPAVTVADARVPSSPSLSSSSSRFSAPAQSSSAAAGSHSPTDRLADVPLQSPIKVSLRQRAEDDDELPEL